jgi:hypothetical protein
MLSDNDRFIIYPQDKIFLITAFKQIFISRQIKKGVGGFEAKTKHNM